MGGCAQVVLAHLLAFITIIFCFFLMAVEPFSCTLSTFFPSTTTTT